MEDDPNKDDKPAAAAGDDESAAAAKEAAEKAAAQAKEAASNAAKVFKSLDLHSQIYFGCMAVMLLFVILFKAWTSSLVNISILSMSPWGPFILLSGLAGIGIFVWEKISTPKAAWVPIAIAGTAGFSALCFLILLMTSGSAGKYLGGGWSVFGFWIPFLLAIGATAVATMRILGAKA